MSSRAGQWVVVELMFNNLTLAVTGLKDQYLEARQKAKNKWLTSV